MATIKIVNPLLNCSGAAEEDRVKEAINPKDKRNISRGNSSKQDIKLCI